MFPYQWSWQQSMMFGSILAATDPVAVVSILKELGVPEKLTMCVSGESLLNDGTAIVLFNLFKALSLGEEELRQIGLEPMEGRSLAEYFQAQGLQIFVYFLKLSVGGVAVGLMCGLVAVLWLKRATKKTEHGDSVVQ